MGLKIRMRKQGKRNHAQFRIVVANSRSPRDGRYVETLGNYNPRFSNENNVMLNEERIRYWVEQGAQISENVEHLIYRVSPSLKSMLIEKKK